MPHAIQGKGLSAPSEAYGLIIQVTYGCGHSRCAFCIMYDDKRFALRPMEEIREDFTLAADTAGWSGSFWPTATPPDAANR